MPFDGTNFEQQDDVLDVLRRARDRVAAPGAWFQGGFAGKRGEVCAAGALIECSGGTRRPRFSDALRVLVGALPAGCRDIPQYNDASGRTQADIVALFDRAIAKREAELQTGMMEV